jgi:glycosyltransferase involved in cell wall biosynthesis
VVKEARVIGLPVVTTPCGGQSDYIEDGANGWLVAPGDIAALSDRLVRTLASIDTARTMGAHRHVEQREWFRPQHTADKFLAIYREITQGNVALIPG